MKSLHLFLITSTLLTLSSFIFTSDSNFQNKTIEIQTMSNFPDEIDGCSCYFSQSQLDFKNGKYIYLDNYENVAFMKINHQLERFTLVSSTDSKKVWSNQNFELQVETTQTGQIDETWQQTGKLILKSSDNQIIQAKIYGECGC